MIITEIPNEIARADGRQTREFISQCLWLVEELALDDVHRPCRLLGLLIWWRALININGYCVRCEWAAIPINVESLDEPGAKLLDISTSPMFVCCLSAVGFVLLSS
jgi:hypothetical protein